MLEDGAVAGKEEEGTPENGEIYNGDGDCIGSIEPPKVIGDVLDTEISLFFEGYLYIFKFDYRTKAQV
jgi:hypothetical protein